MPVSRFRPLLPLLLAAVAMLPSGAPRAFAEEEKNGFVGQIKGFTHVDADRVTGRRKWSLRGDTAGPAPGDASGKRWQLAGLRLASFDKDGRSRLTVAAPAAIFDEPAKRASDSGRVSLEAEKLTLTGRDWVWTNTAAGDQIEIRAGVRVVLSADAAKPGAPAQSDTVIEAKSLRARSDEGGIALAFEGDVVVTRGDARVRADTVTTRVRGAGRAGLPGAADKDAVEAIHATGGVRLEHRSASISGNEATVLPATGEYTVSGDAVFRDLGENRIVVAGSTMRYAGATRHITVAPGADGRVNADLPAIDNPEPEARAHASGESLTIELTPAGNTLRLAGAVRITDPLHTLACERLEVDTPRRETDSVISLKTRTQPTRILAEDTVELVRDGKTVRCGRAEFLPPKNKVVLTGAPRGEVPDQHATFEAGRVTLDTLARTLVAESSTGRPVRVAFALPHSTRGPAKDAPPCVVEAGYLLASPAGASGATFEFEDRVTLEGDDLSGGCDRLGLEVEGATGGARGRLRRIVASGHVKLRQAAYSAEAGRAVILPGAILREANTREDNGLDGKTPAYVSLESAPDTPGVRTRVVLPPMTLPNLAGDGVLAGPSPTAASASPVTVEAEFQDLVVGRERLRAYARGEARIASEQLEGKAESIELVALAAPGTKPGATPRFAADQAVARGGVQVRLGERLATCDTLEIVPRESRITLAGRPHIDGWVDTPGVVRKTIGWTTAAGADGRPATAIRLKEERDPAAPLGGARPTVKIPLDGFPDLGRSLRKK